MFQSRYFEGRVSTVTLKMGQVQDIAKRPANLTSPRPDELRTENRTLEVVAPDDAVDAERDQTAACREHAIG
ncbi:hypothetical protein NQ317_019087 [Molorchus minor]|uniref:Uncharacterized protein n=1 Tax=Molorchus minor TaxID=1323400 RepID=A0ABQ9JKD3_9CUCU|nr:hypothetical protein NQ317_019087 [Molorchus minor]